MEIGIMFTWLLTKISRVMSIVTVTYSDTTEYRSHPWACIGMVLQGGYWEHSPIITKDGKKIADLSKWRGVGSIIIRRANTKYKIELLGDCIPAKIIYFNGSDK